MSDTQFNRILPDPALHKVIDSYWIIREEVIPEGISAIIPMGYPFLEFSLNDNCLIRYQGREEYRYRHFVLGLHTRPLYFRNTSPIHSILVRLQPWGLAVLSTEAARIKIPLQSSSFLPEQQEPLMESLRNAKTPHAYKLALDRFFGRYLQQEAVNIDERISFAMHKILCNRGKLSIASLEQQLFLSQRRLEQLFKQHIGMSLKAYADIARFQAVLAMVGGQHTFSELALEAGYYDQSHFIRHFKRYTGLSPSAFLDLQQNAGGKISNLYNTAR